VIEQYPWSYFHHFGNDTIREGLPWDLLDMQGEQKTWWAGASACFESVLDVVSYNNMILSEKLGS
jgi:hypothetical protein